MASPNEVPGKYDLAITNGGTTTGFVFLRTLDGSYLSASRHRAEYTYTPTFVERQNVGAAYGDDQQAFWQTASQNDWSLGAGVKFRRTAETDTLRQFYTGTNLDVSVPGQVTIQHPAQSVSVGATVRAVYSRTSSVIQAVALSATNLFTVTNAGTVTDQGAHGLGASPATFGIAADGAANVYMATQASGSVGVRRWGGSAFLTFSATTADSLEFLNNTLYGTRSANGEFGAFSTAGVYTAAFVWKDAAGNIRDFSAGGSMMLRQYGAHLLILIRLNETTSEVWQYDGTNTSLLAQMPPGFFALGIEVVGGTAYIYGSELQFSSGSTYTTRPAIYSYLNGTTQLVWRAPSTLSFSLATDFTTAGHPACAAFGNALVFNDDTTGNLMLYDLTTAAIYPVATYTVAGDTPLMAAAPTFILHTRDQATAYRYPDASTVSSTATLTSSLFDFDSSLTKLFRGIKIDADIPTGSSIDIAYQVDSATGSFTTLQTGAASGTEYLLTGVSGHSVCVKITLNKGTSATGPTLKRIYVRAAPILLSYKLRTYNLDLTNVPSHPTSLNDRTEHPLTGYDQAQALINAITSASPITVYDKFSPGGYTGVCEPQACSIFELHSDGQSPTAPGQFEAQITVREI